jgi:putative ABC transport system permease protein
MNYIKLAFRNIVRNRKRSLATILIISLGFIALGVIGGILNNIFSRIREQAIVNEKHGHITFVKKGFFDNGKIEKEKYLFNKAELDGITRIIKANPEVSLATPRLGLYGIVSNGNASSIFLTEATVPVDDKKLLNTKVDGRSASPNLVYLDENATGRTKVAVGEELAFNLKLKKGSLITLLTNTKDGIANAVDVEVERIYNTGNPATNDKFVLTDLAAMQELYDTEGADKIVVVLNNQNAIDKVQTQLQADLTKAGFSVESKKWNEISLSYDKVHNMFNVIFRVLMVIITAIVLLTLLNTLQMTVAERTREIGALRAIGMLRKSVVKMFTIEGVTLTIIGIAVALPILLILRQVLQWLNISFIPPVASISIPINLIFNPFYIIPVVVLFMVVTVISSTIVSRRIAKQPVVTSLANIN